MPCRNLQYNNGESDAQALGSVNQQQKDDGKPCAVRRIVQDILHRYSAPNDKKSHHGKAKHQRQKAQRVQVVQLFCIIRHRGITPMVKWGEMGHFMGIVQNISGEGFYFGVGI